MTAYMENAKHAVATVDFKVAVEWLVWAWGCLFFGNRWPGRTCVLLLQVASKFINSHNSHDGTHKPRLKNRQRKAQ
jgi:hypothetical protein